MLRALIPHFPPHLCSRKRYLLDPETELVYADVPTSQWPPLVGRVVAPPPSRGGRDPPPRLELLDTTAATFEFFQGLDRYLKAQKVSRGRGWWGGKVGATQGGRGNKGKKGLEDLGTQGAEAGVARGWGGVSPAAGSFQATNTDTPVLLLRCPCCSASPRSASTTCLLSLTLEAGGSST